MEYCETSTEIIIHSFRFIYKILTSDLFIGVIAGFIITWYFFYKQFRKSTGGIRIKKVVDATKEYPINETDKAIKKTKVQMFRDRYRYSLGVIIDDMIQVYEYNSENTQDKRHPLFPNLTKDLEKNSYPDRWQKFDDFVRPVINDINPYSFLGWLNIFQIKNIRQLKSISKLCISLEEVFSELDACKEYEISKEIADNHILDTKSGTGLKIKLENVKDEDKMNYDKLTEAFQNLEKSWEHWKRVVNS